MCNETLTPLTRFAATNLKILLFVDILPGVATAIGNTVFIMTLLRTPSLYNPSNVLLGSLCISDILVCYIVRPLFLSFLLKMLVNNEMNLLLKFAFSKSFFYCGGLSFCFAAQVALDRCVAICYPFFYGRHATCRRYVISTGICCVAWLGFTSIQLDKSVSKSTAYTMIKITYILCTISTILVCYGKILQVIRRQRSTQPKIGTFNGAERSSQLKQRNEKSKTNLVAFIIGFFLLSYTPYLAMLVYFTVRENGGCWDTDTIFVANNWVNIFLLWNSCLNPVIYFLKSNQIRKACKRMISRASK